MQPDESKPKTIIKITDELYDYILSVSLREHEILKQLREETARDPWAVMQISPDQGQFMVLLVKLIGARKTLDIGTYTGYSALCIALAMKEDSITITCDINKKWTNLAKRYWEKAGVDHKIDLRLAPALVTLNNLIKSREVDSFDFVFIDADKEHYDEYYEKSLILLRQRGLIIIDNVLWSGNVINKKMEDVQTKAIRKLNEKLINDKRVFISMIAIGDGLILALKL